MSALHPPGFYLNITKRTGRTRIRQPINRDMELGANMTRTPASKGRGLHNWRFQVWKLPEYINIISYLRMFLIVVVPVEYIFRRSLKSGSWEDGLTYGDTLLIFFNLSQQIIKILFLKWLRTLSTLLPISSRTIILSTPSPNNNVKWWNVVKQSRKK